MAQRLGDLLAAQQLVSPRDIDEALKLQKIHGGRLGSILVELEKLDLRALAEVLRGQLGVPIATEDMISRVDSATAQRLTREQVERFQALPLRIEGRRFHVAMMAPQNLKLTEELQFLVGLRLVPYVAPELQLAYWMKKRYGISGAPRFVRLPPEDVISRATGRQPSGAHASVPAGAPPTAAPRPPADDEFLKQRAALFGPSLDSSADEAESSAPAVSSPPRPTPTPLPPRGSPLPPPAKLPGVGAPPVLLRSPSSPGVEAASGAAGAAPPAGVPPAISSSPPPRSSVPAPPTPSPEQPPSMPNAARSAGATRADEFQSSPFYVAPLPPLPEEPDVVGDGEVLEGAVLDSEPAVPDPVAAPPLQPQVQPTPVVQAALAVVPTPAPTPIPPAAPPVVVAPVLAALPAGEDWGSLFETPATPAAPPPAPVVAAAPALATAAESSPGSDLEMDIVEEPPVAVPEPLDAEIVEVDLDTPEPALPEPAGTPAAESIPQPAPVTETLLAASAQTSAPSEASLPQAPSVDVDIDIAEPVLSVAEPEAAPAPAAQETQPVAAAPIIDIDIAEAVLPLAEPETALASAPLDAQPVPAAPIPVIETAPRVAEAPSLPAVGSAAEAALTPPPLAVPPPTDADAPLAIDWGSLASGTAAAEVAPVAVPAPQEASPPTPAVADVPETPASAEDVSTAPASSIEAALALATDPPAVPELARPVESPPTSPLAPAPETQVVAPPEIAPVAAPSAEPPPFESPAALPVAPTLDAQVVAAPSEPLPPAPLEVAPPPVAETAAPVGPDVRAGVTAVPPSALPLEVDPPSTSAAPIGATAPVEPAPVALTPALVPPVVDPGPATAPVAVNPSTGWPTSHGTFGGRAPLDLPEVEGDFELELSDRTKHDDVPIEKVDVESAAAALLPPSSVPMEMADDLPSGLELDTESAPRHLGAPLEQDEGSPLARVLDSHRASLEEARTREAFTEWMSTVLDAISERGAVMEVRAESLIPVRLLGTSADLQDPALTLPLHGSTSFGLCLTSGRAWRGELNEPDELNFALRLGPTTRSVLIPVGAAGGPQWVLWGVVPASLITGDGDNATFDQLAASASEAAKLLTN